MGKSLNLSEPQFPLQDNGHSSNASFAGQGIVQQHRGRSGQVCPLRASRQPVVKEDVGFSQPDSPEDFHGTCHLGNPGAPVSGLRAPPPSPPLSHRCGSLQPKGAHHLSCLGGLWGGPHWEETTDHSVLVPKCRLGTGGADQAGPPCWVQETGNVGIPSGSHRGYQNFSPSTGLALAALPLCGTVRGLPQAGGSLPGPGLQPLLRWTSSRGLREGGGFLPSLPQGSDGAVRDSSVTDFQLQPRPSRIQGRGKP